MTINAMAHPYSHPHPQHPQLSPNSVYPQGSAVNFLGALAQQYQSQQQQLINQHMQHQYQQQYQQQMMMHQMQKQMMMQQNAAATVARDSDGYQYSIQHQQREMQRQMHHGLLSPVPSSTVPQTSTPAKSSTPKTVSPTSVVKKELNKSRESIAEKPAVKKRTNFHSIADLVGDSKKDTVTVPVVQPVAQEAPEDLSQPKKTESLTEFIQRNQRRRSSGILDTSLDSDPGNLVIDEDRCDDFSPAAERSHQTTCSQPIKYAKTPSRDLYSGPISVQTDDTSPGSRAVSPALSTISSVRDTDTPGSVASIDSFSSAKDDEKPRRARSEDDGSKRSSKSRRIFQAPQIHILEQVFAQCQYPEPAFVEKLARDLETTDGKVRVWFQNKRARWRKRSQEHDQSKQSPWLPGTPLYHSGQLSPVGMPNQAMPVSPNMQAALMMQHAQMHPQFAASYMGMH